MKFYSNDDYEATSLDELAEMIAEECATSGSYYKPKPVYHVNNLGEEVYLFGAVLEAFHAAVESMIEGLQEAMQDGLEYRAMARQDYNSRVGV